jgi:glycosyl transferase family 1
MMIDARSRRPGRMGNPPSSSGESDIKLGLPAGRPLELLLLAYSDAPTAGTVSDHLSALGTLSRHRFRQLRIKGNFPDFLDLSRFDGVILHYSVIACQEYYVSSSARAQLARFAGLKAIFIQDEYRFVDRTISAMRDLGISLLFTCVPEAEIAKVYPEGALPNTVKQNVLTGYVPPHLPSRAVPTFAARPIDIGYRGRELPLHLGRLAQEKRWIGERVAAEAAAYGLVTDISCREEDRLYGERWIDFIANCKAVLGVESGANAFDFTGELEEKIGAHLSAAPKTSFEEIERLYLSGKEEEIRLNQISPRCFEAAALRTLMILYEGEYSRILEPWRHYVPLKKDHSNMAEVVAILRNPARAQEIIERAYGEIALNPRYSYAFAVKVVDDAIDAVIRPEMLSRKRAYSAFELKVVCAANLIMWRQRLADALVRATRSLFLRVILGWMPERTRAEVRNRVRRWRGIDIADER